MRPRRLRAPGDDGAVLADPPLGEAATLATANRARLEAWDHDFQGRRRSWLAVCARTRLLETARRYHDKFGLDLPETPLPDPSATPFVVTGHQPELFHPGVWVKNFATDALASALGGAGVNLIVDNDIAKTAAIRVPTRNGEEIRAVRAEFDAWEGDAPFEDLLIRDRSLFDSFPTRVRGLLGDLVDDPVLDLYWPEVARRAAGTGRVGTLFATARRAVEGLWGVRNFEAPLGEVCETEGFLWFASHLLAHAGRFQTIHNDALAAYRKLYAIRSRNHPVAALARDGDWVEAPFWVWRASSPRRRPLWTRQRSKTLELRIGGEDEALLELPLGPDREACCAVERLADLPTRGVRLRTRALTTTMFARTLLADLFVHGIGGAKYDELGDEVSRRFFNFEPPAYLTLTMTRRLGIGSIDPSRPDRLRGLERALRDLEFNPDRHLDVDATAAGDEASRLVESKRAAIAWPTASRKERAARYYEVRRCNAALARFVADRRRELQAARRDLIVDLRREQTARSREYPFILHSATGLRGTLGGVVAAIRTSR